MPVALAAAGAVLAGAAAPLRIIAHQRRRRLNRPEQVDSIAVLGTAQYDGRPSRQLLGRLRHARDLAEQFPGARVFTVGGNLPGDRFTEAGVSRGWLIDHGVDPQRITAVEKGSDTRGSMVDVAAFAPGRTLVVTDPNHCLRAERISRGAGIDAVGSPTPYCPARCPRKVYWLTLAHEVGGLVVQDVAALAGDGAADRLEALLRQIEGWLRPSRRPRHDHLRTLGKKRG